MNKLNLNSEQAVKEWVDQLVDAIEVVDHLFRGADNGNIDEISICGTHWFKSEGVHIFRGIELIFRSLHLDGEKIEEEITGVGSIVRYFIYRDVKFYQIIGEIRNDSRHEFSYKKEVGFWKEVNE